MLPGSLCFLADGAWMADDNGPLVSGRGHYNGFLARPLPGSMVAGKQCNLGSNYATTSGTP